MVDETMTPPEELTPAELGLLAAYRDVSAMPEEAKARGAERIEAAAAPKRPLPIGWIVTAAAVALLFGAWALSGLNTATQQTENEDPNQAVFDHERGTQGGVAEELPAEPPTPQAKQRRSRGQSIEPPVPKQAPAVEAEQTAEIDVPRPAASRPRSPRRPQPPVSKPEAAPVPAGPSELELERVVLRRAWRALARGAHGEAIADAAEHGERFPQGTLAVERKAIAAIARCKAGRADANARAGAFLKAHGKTPLARRVRAACGEKSATE